MATYLDYLEWRGDLTMKERPFNEIDNLILSELAYFHFDELAVNLQQINLTLREVWESAQTVEHPRIYFTNDPLHLLEPCAYSRRFGNIRVTNFSDLVDKEKRMQFCAVTFHLEDSTRYIAFRGTDSSLVGWREDFDFSYLEETPAQAEAVRYLQAALRSKRGNVRIGGHSKGGNLAIYAAAFCKIHSKRVLEVYSNDGPGFNRYVIDKAEYQSILPKVKLIIPESSLVSILCTNKEEKVIVRSTAEDGIHQHLPYTWMVERDHFLLAEQQSAISLRLGELVAKWLELLNDEEKQAFISTLFDVIDASGASTLEELNDNKLISYNAILKAAATLSGEARRSVRDSIIKLAEASKEVFWDETKKNFQPFLLKNTLSSR